MMSNYFSIRKMWPMLLLLCVVLLVSACGKNAASSSASSSLSRNAPLGVGMTPEPGTDGKPMPLPDGHYESMAASDGVVFYAEIKGIAGDNFNEHITALRSSDGSVLWRLPIAAADGFARGTPALSNGVIYIGSNSGSVYAVRVSDGSVLWHVAHTGGFDAIPLDLAPLVDNGMVFMEGKQGPGGQNLALFAMRANDGKPLWSKAQGIEPGPMVNQPQIVGGVIYTVDGVGGLTALRETDGSLVWKYAENQIYGPFIVADGQVDVNSSDGVLALRASDGTLLWKRAINFHDTLSSAGPPEVVNNGIAYVGTTNGTVQALNASDGSLLWHYVISELAVPTNPIYGAYVHFSNTVSYQQAIRQITDLGLQTFADCSFQWKPQGDQDGFSTYHQLTIAATVDSAPSWFNRLQTAPGVVSLQASGLHSCPMMRYDPNALNRLKPDAPVTYIKTTFSDNSGYDNAVEAINNVGFRLANPCYEQTRARGGKPVWNASGQESAFGKIHTLLLSTTGFNATTWLQQLKLVVGVTKVDTAVVTGC